MTPGVGKFPWHLSLYGSEVKLLLLLLLLLYIHTSETKYSYIQIPEATYSYI